MLFKELLRGRVSRAVAASVIGMSALGAARVAGAQSADPVVFSFATVGDSRQDLKSPDATTLLAFNSVTGAGAPNLGGTLLAQDKEWLQNTQAWSTILTGIQAQNPNLLFFNGDMIYGYGRPILPAAWANGQPNSWTTAQSVAPDAIFEYVQYAYWRGMIANLFSNGTYVIPVAGNHETQCSYSAAPYSSSSPNPNCNNTTQGNLTGKTAYADNENAFRANVGDLIQDLVSNIRFSNVSGVTAQNVSGLTAATAATASTNNGAITGSQVELTYSFDVTTSVGVLHFAIINTDPSGADGTAPTDWLAADLAAAKARGALKYFVFGHKPAFTYDYAAGVAAGGLDATAPISLRNAFWQVIAQYGATYFCGHEHIPNVSQNADPTGTYSNKPYQVIVGSGGSPFDDKLVGTCPACTEPTLNSPYDRYYAWALVQVHQSGNVSLQVTGFSDQFGGYQDLTQYDVSTLQ
jgi:Calcineurin-like phosphoesterase